MYIRDSERNRLINFDKFDLLEIVEGRYTSSFKLVVSKCPIGGKHDAMSPARQGEVVLEANQSVVLREFPSKEEACKVYQKIEDAALKEEFVVEI